MTRRHHHWPPERLAQAALLAGRGLTNAEIAEHPLVASTERGVACALSRAGVVVGRAVDADVIRIPPACRFALDAAAATRKTTPQRIARDALVALSDKTLLDNVLDDGVQS